MRGERGGVGGRRFYVYACRSPLGDGRLLCGPDSASPLKTGLGHGLSSYRPELKLEPREFAANVDRQITGALELLPQIA